MKTTCPRCNGTAATSLSATDETVFHNQEFAFVCAKCHYSFTGQFALTRGIPAGAQAFGSGNGSETHQAILTDC